MQNAGLLVSLRTRGVAVKKMRERAGTLPASTTVAKAASNCPAQQCASSATMAPHTGRKWLRWASAMRGLD